MIVDADSHVLEPPDLWTTRMEKKFRDRAPGPLAVKDLLPTGGTGTIDLHPPRFDDVEPAARFARGKEQMAGRVVPCTASRGEPVERTGVEAGKEGNLLQQRLNAHGTMPAFAESACDKSHAAGMAVARPFGAGRRDVLPDTTYTRNAR